MESHDLLVIGNGFDRNLTLRTDYVSFLDFYSEKEVKSNFLIYFKKAYEKGYLENDQWNSFEKALCNYLNAIKYLFLNKSIKPLHYKSQIRLGKKIVYDQPFLINKDLKIPNEITNALSIFNVLPNVFYFSSDIDNKFPVNVESISGGDKYIYLHIICSFDIRFYTLSSLEKFVVTEINKELKKMESELADYIKLIAIVPDNIRSNLLCTRILSFNHSDTAKGLLISPSEQILFIHGQATNEVVLGIEEDMIQGQNVHCEKPYNVFFKQTRRSLKETNFNYKIKILDWLNDKRDVVFFGHSFDKSDSSILLEIFKTNAKKFTIYYYEELDFVKIKIIDLIGDDLFNKISAEGRFEYRLIDKFFKLFDVMQN